MFISRGVPISYSVRDVVEELREKFAPRFLKDVKTSGGYNMLLTCVNHKGGQEGHPSMGILLEDNNGRPAGLVHCFACGFSTDLAGMVSVMLGGMPSDSLGQDYLTKYFGDCRNRPDIKLDMTRGAVSQNPNINYVADEELAKYRYTHPYMYKRGLSDKIINYFDIGFDRATRSITIPVHDCSGRVVFIQRRRVDVKKFYFPKGAKPGNYLYGEYQVLNNLEKIGELWIVESALDALLLWSYKKPAVAIFTATPTNTQIKKLLEIPVRQMVLALDNDKAGMEGVKVLQNRLGQRKILYLPELGGAKDVGEVEFTQIPQIKCNLILDMCR